MSAIDFSQLNTLSVSIDNNIAHIQLSRPEALNSMNANFWRELPAVVKQIDQQAAARVIVLSAQGKHFSAGMDLAVFSNMATDVDGEPARRAERTRNMVLTLQETFSALETIRIPVLAAIQGGAMGGGLELVCACDSRYCSVDAFFSVKETQVGITADAGTLQRLPHLMPASLVRELAYTGRNMKSAEALSCGFVSRVFDDQQALLEGVMKIATQIAANSPMAVSGTKEMLNYTRDHSVADGLNYIATWQAGMFQMPDVLESIQAQKEKRLPNYDNLYEKPTGL